MASKYRQRNYRPNQLIHSQLRGHNRKPIFLDRKDHDQFHATLRRMINRAPAKERPKLLATASLRNHQHLFTQNGSRGDATSRIITATKISYAAYFNDRHQQTGPVFEAPFKARRVQGGDDIINVMAYIHLNPDATARTTNSTHAIYTGEIRDPFIDATIPLKAFGGRDNYIEFFNDTEKVRVARAAARKRFG
ncbi:MAG: transposase [Thermoleophilaceae bacterium]|nr:transposase [Thermoleophilaceae bacterium]